MILDLPQVIAHRGAPQLAPENTIPAFIKAQQHNATWVEFDVMLTKDNVPIIFHDENLLRITGLNQLVIETPYATIKNLDAGKWLHSDFSGTRIPTFEEFLQKAAELKLGINIELKPAGNREEILAEKVLALLKKMWPTALPSPLISCFSAEALIALKIHGCTYPIAYNTYSWHDDCRKIAAALGCYSIHMHQKEITQERVAENTRHNLKTLVYTVNEKSTALKLLDLGITAVFSDIPNLLTT